MTVFGSKIKVDLDLSLLRLILTVIPVCHVGSFCNTYFFHLREVPLLKKGAHKEIKFITTDKH